MLSQLLGTSYTGGRKLGLGHTKKASPTRSSPGSRLQTTNQLWGLTRFPTMGKRMRSAQIAPLEANAFWERDPQVGPQASRKQTKSLSPAGQS